MKIPGQFSVKINTIVPIAGRDPDAEKTSVSLKVGFFTGDYVTYGLSGVIPEQSYPAKF